MLDECLLDPDLMDDKTSDASSISTSRGDFADRVAGRDTTCVTTNSEEDCQACHIIPHSKGHQVCSEYLLNHSEFSFQAKYIINLVHHMNSNIVPPLESINDTRNGILLYSALHGPFGASKIAFLRVGYLTKLPFHVV